MVEPEETLKLLKKRWSGYVDARESDEVQLMFGVDRLFQRLLEEGTAKGSTTRHTELFLVE